MQVLHKMTYDKSRYFLVSNLTNSCTVNTLINEKNIK